MRTLIAIPIIHTEQDMGSLREQARQEYVARYGQEKWDDHLKSIDEIWDGIRQMIAALELPHAGVRLYQDGLPQCNKEVDIVRDVAARGSKNHQILMDLMQIGAHLMGTEDPQLLLQEYQYLQGALGGKQNLAEANQQQEQSLRLLALRDRFIAARINATLASGEIGLLFLGMAHAVEPLLDADILVRHLLPSLREKQAGMQ